MQQVFPSYVRVTVARLVSVKSQAVIGLWLNDDGGRSLDVERAPCWWEGTSVDLEHDAFAYDSIYYIN